MNLMPNSCSSFSSTKIRPFLGASTVVIYRLGGCVKLFLGRAEWVRFSAAVIAFTTSVAFMPLVSRSAVPFNSKTLGRGNAAIS
eukprot:CAMPEP_0196585274 /NCGR_PEP_ID=MMETSP1081-20130531/50085_1 /TAXON_ID=36882 /ORGANISM="Pyramimonas amylifera, Strain CCMP720" /LENGTH=83 /DNA_ID=CAMNT_0041906763 /DNA_START=110 /DNA_END=358 /DNA_ORIENTATION=+